MLKVHPVKLEFVRPGPPHNQLLSPLTPYMALCGGGSPITFYLDFEHHQFLSRLDRLRYVTTDGRSGVAVADPIREATVAEVGMDVARIFAKVNSLLAKEWQVMGDAETGAHADDTELVDLRLVISGSELALIPFEMAIAPQAYPGEGLEWALQYHLPIVPIREIRSNRPAPVPWNRPLKPKILFISAAPEGLDVPLSSHVHALRAALDPWVSRPAPPAEDESDDQSEGDTEEQSPVPLIKERLRLLPNASIDDIYAICAQEQFTHVHILAHGAELDVGGEKRFGLALCDPNDGHRMNVVSGKRLAKALLAEGDDGTRRSQPVMVTLATCDSGNPGSVLIPGGGIAHDLHAAGIPWVLASQFPLTKVGSVRMTEALYQRILRGDDPRQALFEVRCQLFMNAERDHDWASLVAYATIPDNFEDQVAEFFEEQTRRAINVALEQADHAIDDAEMEKALEVAIGRLELWRSRLPEAGGYKVRVRQAECLGMYGSTLKRIGLLHYKKGQASRAKNDLQEALDWYTKAMNLWSMEIRGGYHWVATQALSLKAVLKKPEDPDNWRLAHYIAGQELAKSTGSAEAWAHGTLAELIMLKKYHMPDEPIGNIKKEVQKHCQAIVHLMGEDAFEVYSTRRQFQRYIKHWPSPDWNVVAKAAVATLSPPGGKD